MIGGEGTTVDIPASALPKDGEFTFKTLSPSRAFEMCGGAGKGGKEKSGALAVRERNF